MMESRIKRPNFFILGAGRCGSTTLYSMLKQHPQIFMSKEKEPSFFCSYFQVVKDPISYYNLFTPSEGQTAIGEASHAYLSNPESPEVLHALFPRARFILIFRNPTERAYSLYNWTRRAKLEPCETFEEALEAEELRFEDKEFFNNCPQYFWNFMYVKSSYFHVQWQRYLQYYSRDQFFVLSLNELASNPQYWISQVFDFLNVDRTFSPTTKHMNKASYPSMQAKTKRRLDDHFQEVVAATQELSGRDLNLL